MDPMPDGDLARIGVSISTVGLTSTGWLAAAEHLAGAGYGTIWAWDHFMGHVDPTTPVLETFTLLVTASERIRTARIGTLVTNVMNRHPAVLARMASTVQDVTGGRFRLGLRIGGSPRGQARHTL